MTMFELETNGEDWQKLRHDQIYGLDDRCHLYTVELRNLVKQMLKRDYSQRPSAEDILKKHFPGKQQLDIRFEKKLNLGLK